ncbi:MAG: PrsW family intramembrane metalloprotease [Lachnospiraceae bacterium]|nr:PrsW family intramembrane metalloprotease [Lachnospiraceae bacterium]
MANQSQQSSQKGSAGKTFSAVTSAINRMSGEEGKANIKLGELFSGVFKKHSKEERERLFTAGLTGTVPDERSMIAEWPRPWFYARVFAVLFLLTAVIYLLLFYLYHLYLTSTMILLAVLMTPVSMVLFLFECNIPRNISLLDCVYMSLVGGVVAMIVSVLVSSLQPAGTDYYTWYGAIISAIIEMIGITILIYTSIKKNNSKYLLNGLLIGAAIGAGFCILENFGRLFSLSAECAYFDENGLVYISYFRPQLFQCWIFSIGTHVVWGALIGAGFVAAKQDGPLTVTAFKNPLSLRFFTTVLLLQIIYLFPLPAGRIWLSYLVPGIIALIGLVLLLFQISAGLRQINRLSNEAWQADAAAMPEEADD